MICKMMERDQIGAILQSIAKDSKIHFHKSQKINKRKISIRNFHNHLSNNILKKSKEKFQVKKIYLRNTTNNSVDKSKNFQKIHSYSKKSSWLNKRLRMY